MIPWRPAALAFVAIGLAIAVSATRPAAATLCGDANADGAVTLTDGVIVLRVAAGLSTACTTAVCDVDGSGRVTVTDGVNVLRNAAKLSSMARCAVDADPGDTEKITSALLPFIAFGFQGLTGASSGSSIGPAADGIVACPDGGIRTTSGTLTRTILIEQCAYSSALLGHFQFDGSIVIDLLAGRVHVEVDVRDLTRDVVVRIEGAVDGDPRAGGGFLLDDGPVTVQTSDGDFLFIFDRLVVDRNGDVQSGGGIAEDSLSGSFDVDTVEFDVQSATAARLAVRFDDGTTRDFILDLATGELTPA